MGDEGFRYQVVGRRYLGADQHGTSRFQAAMTGRVADRIPYKEAARELDFELASRINRLWADELRKVSYRNFTTLFQIDGADYYFGAVTGGIRDSEAQPTEQDREQAESRQTEEAEDAVPRSARKGLLLGYVWSPEAESPVRPLIDLSSLLMQYAWNEADREAVDEAVAAIEQSKLDKDSTGR